MTRRSLFQYLVGVAASTVLARLPLAGAVPVDFDHWPYHIPPPIGVKWWVGTLIVPEEMLRRWGLEATAQAEADVSHLLGTSMDV